MAKFTHLHVHTEYSLLDGLCKIDKLVDKAVELGMDSLAITDHGVMHGVVKFYLAAKEAGIKPVIGMEAYMAKRSRLDRKHKIDSDRFHLVLLAKNNQGYKNLMKLSTIGHLEGFYYKPRIDLEVLEKYSKGLIGLSACLKGRIPKLLINGQDKKAQDWAQKLQKILGGDFYLEIQNHPAIPEQEKANRKLVKLSRKLGIPLVATNDVHYINKDDAEAQDALLAVQTQKLIADKNRLSMIDSPDFHLRSQEEMVEIFDKFPDAIENTKKIAKQCKVEIPIGNWILPEFPIPEGKTAKEYLKELVKQRVEVRFPKPDKSIYERLDYELDIICKKGFATYFLIVQDFVNWAKKQKIRVGPGRGSVAGSLVSYVLRITSVDPLKHNIPFERFMNPKRPSPPDIDLDFADDRRDEVIEYVAEKYGHDKVAQIITFGTMEARQAIRDMGRVLGLPYSEPDKIAKLIPQKASIKTALEQVPELEQFYQHSKYKKLFNLAKKVEGVSRHSSVHAAGVVIADKKLTEYTPLQKEVKGEKIITQYDMYSLDLNVSPKAIGLLKMDFLGLRNLTILEKTRALIKKHQGEVIDISEIPLDDQETFQTITSGETTGIFQLESGGMRRLARKLKPNRFSDISAMVALYRPGPMQFIDEFISRKKSPETADYPHPDLKPILEETYGIAVYQEQCLHIANVMGGYDMGEADILRRAIGKKKRSIMKKEESKFIKRAIEAGYKKKIARKVWGLIERFAGYGFNKAHSTSYAMISYQTAYLKTHYPVEFMTALLSVESRGSSGPARDRKLTLAIEDCRRLGIKVLPPDINSSAVLFTIEPNDNSYQDQAIRFGLSAIKNVGKAAVGAILKARKKSNFNSLSDFCRRVDARKVNKKVIESLIKAGALDAFGKRAAMLTSLDQIRNRAASVQKHKRNGQVSLFAGHDPQDLGLKMADKLPDIEEFSKDELLKLEKDLLGFYLTEHPLSPLMSILEQQRTHKLFEVLQGEEVGQRVKVGGLVTDVRIVLTRKDSREMAFAQIEDDTSSVEIVVFPGVYSSTKHCWAKEQVVLVDGKVESRGETISIIAGKASILTDKQEDNNPEYNFEIELPATLSPHKLVRINKLLKNNQGDSKIALVFIDDYHKAKRLILPYGVAYSEKLKNEILQIVEQN